MKKQYSEKGLTLVEAMVGVVLAAILFGSLLMSALAVRSVRSLTQHHIQAMNVARGVVERLKGSAYAAVLNDSWNEAYDAGPDGLFGTGDDRMGTVTVTVKDFLDMDHDGNVNETLIDVTGDLANDAAKPVRVTYQWTERLRGQDSNYSVRIDTLITS